MKKLALLLFLIAGVALGDAVIFSGSDVKALKGNLDLNGLAKILTLNGDPSTGAGISAPKGSLALSLNQGAVYQKYGVPSTSWKKMFSGVIDLTSDVTGILPLANGGTGSSARNFVDLVSTETIAGTKTFSSTISGSINGNAATVTTNANLTGPITSSGNTTSVAAQTGTGSTFVMQASPTLTTPNIGAAMGTSLSVSGQLTSTVATGTAPLAVTSTTKVTNLYADRAALADTVTTNASLTGAVTSTGNATSLGSFTSANLSGALSDETGSGAAVFATSPALVTPNLGTPSAATLTNATGLPISTGVSGLATGMATFLATPTSANLAATVTNETGSGNLVFSTSPTFTTPTLGDASGSSLVLGGTIAATAILDVQSTTKAFYPPRMTSTQKGAISSPAEGAVVWDTTNHALYGYNGSGFVASTVPVGTPITPGVTAGTNLDHFMFTFGNTSTTTCSSATCGYVDQYGSAVTGVSRTAIGGYTINFARTYTKTKCIMSGNNGSAAPTISQNPMVGTGATLSFVAYIPGSGATDTIANVECWGNY